MPVVTDSLGRGQKGTGICVHQDLLECLSDTNDPCCTCHFECSAVQQCKSYDDTDIERNKNDSLIYIVDE